MTFINNLALRSEWSMTFINSLALAFRVAHDVYKQFSTTIQSGA